LAEFCGFQDHLTTLFIMKKYVAILIWVCCSGLAYSQTIINGKVIDGETGNALVGATIMSGNADLYTSTDSSGNFYLTLKSLPNTVTARFVGYDPQTITIKSVFKKLLIVKLKSQNNTLSEVTISTGYQSLSKEQSPGSFATVDNELFNRRVSTYGDASVEVDGHRPITLALFGHDDDDTIAGLDTPDRSC